jgi:hypothetical protein
MRARTLCTLPGFSTFLRSTLARNHDPPRLTAWNARECLPHARNTHAEPLSAFWEALIAKRYNYSPDSTCPFESASPAVSIRGAYPDMLVVITRASKQGQV